MSDNYVTPSATAPASPPVPDLGVPTIPAATPVTDLTGRDETVAPAIDTQFLAQVCAHPSVLRNNHSPGASGLLKEFLHESGYPYEVVREIFTDGGAHQVGNAIDVTSTDMGALCRFLRQVPELFQTAVCVDADYASDSLYVSDGAVVGSLSFDEPVGRLHLATTYGRFGGALKLATVRSALTTAAQGQFTNRDVYAVGIDDIGAHISEPMVAFW
jgi:hypothetical protein